MTTTDDRTQAKRIEHLREEEARRDEASLRFLLSDEKGRWFLSRIMERAHLHEVASGDIHQILLFEGERRVGVELYQNLRTLASLDESGKCYEELQKAEREYGAFLARYNRKER